VVRIAQSHPLFKLSWLELWQNYKQLRVVDSWKDGQRQVSS
jgi:hypothetical protein